MGAVEKPGASQRIQTVVYSSFAGVSLTALILVAVMEVLMLVYSCIDLPLFGPYLWIYRAFYLVLLAAACVYLALHRYAQKDMARRWRVLRTANPVYSVFFFAWALGITWFDASKYASVDATVFMLFSLIVPMSFYLAPTAYAVIVVAADVAMLSLTVFVTGSVASIINTSIFAVFQLVLGFSFQRLRRALAERIVEEQDNAGLDVLTGFPNRRVYTEDMRALEQAGAPDGLAYLSIDLNGLKEVNDNSGHDAGDRLLQGAAECIKASFGERAKHYRIGGDEFVVLTDAPRAQLDRMIADYEARTKRWSVDNAMPLSTALGCVTRAEAPGASVSELARTADERMYMAKAHYYCDSGLDRRRYTLAE